MWRDDKQHGLGKYSWANGAEYEGVFNQGRIDGQGVFVSTQGWTFTGMFALACPTKGVMLDANSQVRSFCTLGPKCGEIWTNPKPALKVPILP